MSINIKVEKRHIYILSFLIILTGTILFVQAQTPNFGHEASHVNVEFNGTTKTLQEASDNRDFIGKLDCHYLKTNGQYSYCHGNQSYVPVSCSCGYNFGSWTIHYNENRCHCHTPIGGQWTAATCCRII